MYRKRSTQLRYDRDRVKLKTEKCVFCDPDPKIVIKKYQNFILVKNIYPYDLWDKRLVKEHLMIVPKVHVAGLEDIKEDQMEEYIKIVREYSKKGYDSFTRSSASPIKTKLHVHTHLIKADGKIIKMLHFNEDPYYLLYK